MYNDQPQQCTVQTAHNNRMGRSAKRDQASSMCVYLKFRHFFFIEIKFSFEQEKHVTLNNRLLPLIRATNKHNNPLFLI